MCRGERRPAAPLAKPVAALGASPGFIDLAAGLAEGRRMTALLAIAHQLPPASQVEMVKMLEPNPPWTKSFLEFRLMAYRHVADPRAKDAEQDLREFLRETDAPL